LLYGTTLGMRLEMTARSGQLLRLVAAFVAASILSNVALLDFYIRNANELDSPARVVRYAEIVIVVVALISGLIKLLRPKFALWRILLAVGAAAFVFFSYDQGKGLPRRLAWGGEEWFAIAWIAVTIAAGLIALVSLHRPASVSVILVLSIAIIAPSGVRAFTSLAKPRGAATSSNELVASDSRNRISPNIYWIVLDGYPRRDVLKQNFGFDNGRFLQALDALDFTVLENSLSNFPATIYSISSTLSMDYVVRTSGEGVEPFASSEIYPVVKGKSRVVSRLKAAGYNYVHFENGYDYLTKCAAGEPRCVQGRGGLSELDVAILSNTPLIDLVTDFEEITGKGDAHLFAWGGVDDLGAKLGEIQKTPAPFFVYAHVLAPHPPMRFRADCSARPADPDLQAWDPAARPAFIDQLRCTNAQTEILLQRLVRSDPGAIVIVQSDHGTAFNGQFPKPPLDKPPTDWSDADLHERFGVLNAMRLPAECRNKLRQDLTLVDTFPLVLSCLTGEEFERHQPRFFVTPYDNSPEFGVAIEYPADRVQAGLGH
jgi:Sulfatase